MDAYKNISSIAELIGAPVRTAILIALSNGNALPAGELAYIAKVKPQTASAHLSKLVNGGLLTVETQGRHRYYRIPTNDVVRVIEAIAVLTPKIQIRSLRESDELKVLRYARTCYDHLAGRLGVELTRVFEEEGYIEPLDQDYNITSKGIRKFENLGIDTKNFNRNDDFLPGDALTGQNANTIYQEH
ncbi:winged helix-turn-helix domain-containing protein [Aneurinibacillus migulanus]|uniref:ArsR/SmtB family transcription factor n=1 Tax=Aneurinibacillus migulanus TaxID=47500 RepID=UPI002E20BE8F|nr:winged helix-turn-helix domain-containing protein [Aneurinibacillus migulanus]